MKKTNTVQLTALYSVFHRLRYYGAFLFFAVGATTLNLIAIILMLFPQTKKTTRTFQKCLRKATQLWTWYLTVTRTVKIQFHGFEKLSELPPSVIIANHPGLMDALFIISRLECCCCIYKAAIKRNPILNRTAQLAGFVSNDNGVDTIRNVLKKAKNGTHILLFPEGSRTLQQNGAVNPFNPTYVLIAQKGKIPIQTVLIHANNTLLSKERPFFAYNREPVEVNITLGQHFLVDNETHARTRSAEIEVYFRHALSDARNSSAA